MTDAEKLAELARGTVLAVMAEGEATHEPGEWLRQKLPYHIEHLKEHAAEADWLRGMRGKDEAFVEELTHALTRAAMALYVYQKGKDHDYVR